jgi:hypothetical protein
MILAMQIVDPHKKPSLQEQVEALTLELRKLNKEARKVLGELAKAVMVDPVKK